MNLSAVLNSGEGGSPEEANYQSPFKSAPKSPNRIYDTVENLATAVKEEPQYDRIPYAFGKRHSRKPTAVKRPHDLKLL